MEIWKDVIDYELIYEVSNNGKIRNKSNGRLLSPSFDNHGYLQVNLTKGGSIKSIKFHRVVAKAFIPNPENKPCVNHKDGIKHNNNPYNLEWVTYSENNTHSYKTGLASNKGDNHPCNKLNSLQVIEIYKRRDLKAKELAVIYNVSIHAINDIRKGKTWNHITKHNERINYCSV